METTRPTTATALRRLAAALAAALALAGLPAAAHSAPEAPAGADYTDRVIVDYRPGVGSSEQRPLEQRAGVAATVERLEGLSAEVVRVEADPAVVADRLERSPKVRYAEPDFVMSADSRPNDALFNQLWGLHNYGQTGGTSGADIGALAGWDRAGLDSHPFGGGERVAVIDTGILASHPDLQGKVIGCETRRRYDLIRSCADDSGHGTHVSGTLAATADDGQGVAGVAFNSPLLVCRALGGPEREGFTSDIAECVHWARGSGARVISMSFGGPPSETLHRALKRAWKGGRRRGAVLVAAAGNGQGRAAIYPAAHAQVISTAATDDRDRAADFSNRHSTVELAAPGVEILSTWFDGGYRFLNGTSMGVPHVAGVAAQLRGLRPRWGADRIRDVMRRSATDLGRNGDDARYGYGRVDLSSAVRRVR